MIRALPTSVARIASEVGPSPQQQDLRSVGIGDPRPHSLPLAGEGPEVPDDDGRGSKHGRSDSRLPLQMGSWSMTRARVRRISRASDTTRG